FRCGALTNSILERDGDLRGDFGGIELVRAPHLKGSAKPAGAQHAVPLQRKKILEELLAGFGENGFGVELHAFDLVTAVTEAHDDAVVGLRSDRQLVRQGFSLDDQGMIACGGEGIRQLAENILAVMMDLARFAVKQFGSADDFAAERSANGLVAEAHTKDGKFPGQALDELHGNARLLGRARPWRNYDAFRIPPGNLFDGNPVVAMHFDVTTQLAEILREVVGEGIVVVEKQNHDAVPAPRF